MFNVIYRWTVKPGSEAEFEAAWSEATELIRQHRGGLGSRLHRAKDGSFLAYAQWSSEETWLKSQNIALPDNSSMDRMAAVVVSSEAPLRLQLLWDQFQPRTMN